MQLRTLAIAAAAGICAASASAEIVEINIVGTVDFSFLPSGPWSAANPGDDVVMSFRVDSDNYTDSTNFPTRGYSVESFALTVAGHTSSALADPYPDGREPLFVIRNDDPAVDGFFLGSSVDGFNDGIAIDEPASILPTFDALFSATYEGTRLESLDILDAVGTYDFAGLSVFNWGIEDGPVQPMGFIFDSWSISVVPTPGAVSVLAMGGLVMSRRRR